MRTLHWFLLILSAFCYALPFLLSDYIWWAVFLFPIPLLFIVCEHNLSFVQGYVWGSIVFLLHLSGGVYIMGAIADQARLIGWGIGLVMVFYQALTPALIFGGASFIARTMYMRSVMIRLLVWIAALMLFITWTDRYCLWCFGSKEGYPLMHPLILLTYKPWLLSLVPVCGKMIVLLLFLLVSMGIVVVIKYQHGKALLFCIITIIPWIFCWSIDNGASESPFWQSRIKSLPYMAYSYAKNPVVMVKVIGSQLRKIITESPHTEIVVMPESAMNISSFGEMPELVALWHSDYVGKPIHFIFGASRLDNGHYYNSLHWVYNGLLTDCCDKRHAMLISERLPVCMNNDFFKKAYFNDTSPVSISSIARKKLSLLENVCFVPYICSELFFNEYPDDDYENMPIIAIINDSYFGENRWVYYIQKLLVLLAQFKALQWQREIVYISYAQSLIITKNGLIQTII